MNAHDSRAAGLKTGIMTGETTLREAIARLSKAIEALENSVAARLEQEQD